MTAEIRNKQRTGFIRAYVVTMRPYLMFVSGITGVAGLAQIPNLDVRHALLVFAASFLAYGFGQALTDCFQIDTDSISSPYRPLTQGIISRKLVFLVSIVGLVCCTAIFAYYNPFTLTLGLAAMTGLGTYTYFKRRWFGGPWYNAWIVVVLCLMAWLTGQPPVLAQDFSTQLAWTLAAVFFGYANFVLAGYFKDIDADRATGYNTLPVVFGRRVSARASDCLALLAVVCTIEATTSSDRQSYLSALFVVGGILTSFVAQFRLHRVKADSEAHQPIALVVHSYILLLSGFAISQKPDWTIPLILLYGGYIVVMHLRPEKTQI